MKTLVLTLALTLVLAGGATAGGPHLRDLVERVGLLEAADVDHAAALAALEAADAEHAAELATLERDLTRALEREHRALKCMSLRVRALERNRRPPRLCGVRGLPGGPVW